MGKILSLAMHAQALETGGASKGYGNTNNNVHIYYSCDMKSQSQKMLNFFASLTCAAVRENNGQVI